MIHAFPKIFVIGKDYIRDIFNEDVEITEKIDGSQFSFGRIGGKLYIRSKGAQLFIDNPEGMFVEGISYVEQIQDKVPDNMIFYCEYLKKRKHNTLFYDRVPKNHLILFGVMRADEKFSGRLTHWSMELEIERVPLIYQGKISSSDEILKMLDQESILGGPKIEGVVVKNYSRPFLLGGQPIPLMAGKFVSDSFKEVHRERWGKEEKSKGRMQMFFESFKTEARWEKAVQHLREEGQIENEPRDIGKLFKAVNIDIETEEMEAAKDFLWKEFKGELTRTASRGLAEWYKKKLLEKAFE